MRVYHFTTAEHGLSAIRDRRLKIAEFPGLNDPFEFLGVKLPTPLHRRIFNEWKDALGEKSGMLCFSRNRRNPVQWAHYADRHKGVCLGFDMQDGIAHRVRYVPKPLEIDLDTLMGGVQAQAEPIIREILAIKFSHWRYEQEMRLFANLDERCPKTNLFFHDLGPHLVLREVLVGHRCTLTRPEVTAALGSQAAGVTVDKVRLAFNSFRVVRQRNKALW